MQPSTAPASPRMRIRKLLPDLHLGDYPPGPLNSLTDVPGIKVHTQEIIDRSGAINTGVTCIMPREDLAHQACYAGLFRFNGSGELTGSHFIAETGLLCSPIVLTGTLGVGAAHQGVYEYAVKALGVDDNGQPKWMVLPVVAETFDGWLHKCTSFAVRPEHVIYGLEHASADRVPEGNVGGGRGMICHGLKGGTGSSSRRVLYTYTIAALVQANYGVMKDPRIAGVPVGRILAADIARSENVARRTAQMELEKEKAHEDGSIIVLQRIAKRATVGLARVGGVGHNLSGDIFLAFSTGNVVPVNQRGDNKKSTVSVGGLDDSWLNEMFEAAADATEEAIYNALCMAETMVGNQGHRVEALPLERVKEIMEKYMVRE
ncbi:L-aminopeptidase/D-esterase [Delphinella strobiligena]|nr:L-aminopeptidase/D-esterase [Delphinella strobiligena]